MPNGGITKKTFSRMNTDEKLDVLFDQQSEMIDNTWFSEERLKKLEKWQIRLTGAFFFAIIVILPGIEIAVRVFY